MFLLFLSPNKVETVQPMRSCRKSSGVITPTLHTNASINRQSIVVTTALLAQMDLNLHFWYRMTTCSSFTPPLKLSGGTLKPLCVRQISEERQKRCSYVTVEPGMLGMLKSRAFFSLSFIPPPPPTTENISRAFPISSFLKRCCDSRGI